MVFYFPSNISNLLTFFLYKNKKKSLEIHATLLNFQEFSRVLHLKIFPLFICLFYFLYFSSSSFSYYYYNYCVYFCLCLLYFSWIIKTLSMKICCCKYNYFNLTLYKYDDTPLMNRQMKIQVLSPLKYIRDKNYKNIRVQHTYYFVFNEVLPMEVHSLKA